MTTKHTDAKLERTGNKISVLERPANRPREFWTEVKSIEIFSDCAIYRDHSDNWEKVISRKDAADDLREWRATFRKF